MKKNNVRENETIISRVIIMLFAFALLTLATWLYVMPFSKHYLVINNYYKIIEYIVIGVLFITTVVSYVYSYILNKKQVDFSKAVITPFMIKLLTTSALIASVIIPLSNNRTVISKYFMLAYVFVYIAYLCFYTVKKQFAFLTVVCGTYSIVFLLLDEYYPFSITFNDTISLSYSTALLLFTAFIIVVTAFSYAYYKRHKDFKILNLLIFSFIAIVAVIVRIFTLNYISLIAVALEVLSLITMIVIEKLYKK